MPENKPNFLEGFKKSDIIKSASMDIKPRLQIESLGIENCVDVEILSEPYQVEIPEEKAYGNTSLWMIDVFYEGVEHQFYAQASSFRFQLGVLAEKFFNGIIADLVGHTLKIWREKRETKNFGQQELYLVSLID